MARPKHPANPPVTRLSAGHRSLDREKAKAGPPGRTRTAGRGHEDPAARRVRPTSPAEAPDLLAPVEIEGVQGREATLPSSLGLERHASAARSGRAILEERVNSHTETGPAMTSGDVDADWVAAYSVGDETPGGDNPTPDQDVVDEIGRALGVEYSDEEELDGDRVVERDRHRWELDPASSEDYQDRVKPAPKPRGKEDR